MKNKTKNPGEISYYQFNRTPESSRTRRRNYTPKERMARNNQIHQNIVYTINKQILKILCSELREFHRRGGRKSVGARGYGGQKESKFLQINWAKLMNSQRLKEQAQVLHSLSPGPHIYITGLTLVFLWGSCVCEWVVLILVPFLRLFSFCWFALSNFDEISFVLSYFILLCFMLSLKSLFFLMRQKGNGFRREGSRGRRMNIYESIFN